MVAMTTEMFRFTPKLCQEVSCVFSIVQKISNQYQLIPESDLLRDTLKHYHVKDLGKHSQTLIARFQDEWYTIMSLMQIKPVFCTLSTNCLQKINMYVCHFRTE